MIERHVINVKVERKQQRTVFEVYFLASFLACVAGGIVTAREIKFWRRSRQASGEAARRMGRGISESLSPFSSRLRRSLVQNFISRALTIPPATQATSF